MFTKLIARVATYMQARETERLLNTLSDAALKDIGVTRAGISDLVAHATPIRVPADRMPTPVNANRPVQPLARAA